ncbi:HD domain-containing protein [Pedobacter changchengzhani]|uniref:HD domain-containing protein n=1 Tax=Pedobacter changchengzhani TaxID=2529274 RepID=A0A4R5ML03_9SPHI|nr:Pycsar system effector family protein [Pedobacter changchengzhani]TDG35885.1 HD domain-containing protein [Pedobacter changchengzhani]
MKYSEIQNEAKQYVSNYFETHKDVRLAYHNAQHTAEVIRATEQIANHYQLNERDYFIVVLAATFHDVGYFEDAKNHEQKGAEIADVYLKNKGIPQDIRTEISNTILSTKIPQNPANLLENILCDADLFHLGTEEFRDRAKLMHKEVELICERNISKSDWRKKDLDFLEKHHYHTDYCQLLLNDQKQKNLDKIKSKLKVEEPQIKPEAVVIELKPVEPETKNEKKNKRERPEKGIETMFRITSANNQRLSDMADNKAHILITVNSIILSLIVSLLLRRLENNSFLMVPTFMLLIVSLACVVVSILSTRPSIPSGVFNDEDLKNKRVNLLFFGNFYKMPLDNYANGMRQVMGDKEFLYGTLIRDVYSQGVVLGRKYKLIRLAYNIFMFGIVLSVLSFMVAYLWFGKD